MKLAEVCSIVGGGTPSKKNKAYYSGNIPWASVRDMNKPILTSTEFRISDEAVRESATNVIPAGEVIISTHVGLGKVCILAQDTAINQDLKAVIPTVDIDRRYLYHWFVSQAPKLVAAGKGATVKGVTVKFVLDLDIPIPSRNSQQSIAKQLSLVLECVKKRQAQLARLDALAKSLFVEMFATKCPTVSIGDLFHVGGPKRIHKGEWTNKGVPFWKVSELTARITGEQVKPSAFISSSRYRQLKDEGFVPVPSDILVTARGTLGKFYVVRAEDEFYFQDGMITWLSRMSPRLNLSYFLAAVSSPEFRKQYEGKSPGTTVAYLSISQLSKLTVPLPPLSLQQAFAERVEAIDKSKFAIRKSLDELNRLYRSLLQQYFG